MHYTRRSLLLVQPYELKISALHCFESFDFKILIDSYTSLISGESMENALRACCKGIKIGKILIHGEGSGGREVGGATPLFYMPLSSDSYFLAHIVCFICGHNVVQLIYEKLPSDIASRHVLFLDPVLSTGLEH